MTQEKSSSWETETGLPNDIDAWIANPRFGYKEEYAQKVQETTPEGGLMFLVDLVDEKGELQGSQGWSVGSGWTASDDGLTISHPKRKNVVGSSLYGQLQNRVVKDLKVNMDQYGIPTDARSWVGLGFHWLLTEHSTVGGPVAQGLMPTEFLGKKEGIAVEARPAPGVAVEAGLERQLKELAQTNTIKDFQKAALRIPGVADSDELMASILDEGPTGFYATHQ